MRHVTRCDPCSGSKSPWQAISSKVLRHLFLQMGREIAAEELEAMVALVDMCLGVSSYNSGTQKMSLFRSKNRPHNLG